MLSKSASISIYIGATGSLSFMFWSGRNNTHLLLTLLFTLWVLAPFVIMIIISQYVKHWQIRSQKIISITLLATILVSLAVYFTNLIHPPKAQAAFVFVMVPPASMFLLALGFFIGWNYSKRER